MEKIEDQLALKNLVDTFSNLADVKDTKAQMNLFTDDAEVISKADGKTLNLKVKKKLKNLFLIILLYLILYII